MESMHDVATFYFLLLDTIQEQMETSHEMVLLVFVTQLFS